MTTRDYTLGPTVEEVREYLNTLGYENRPRVEQYFRDTRPLPVHAEVMRQLDAQRTAQTAQTA